MERADEMQRMISPRVINIVEQKAKQVNGDDRQAVRNRLLNDHDVKKFLNKYQELLTDDMIEKGLSEFNHFIKARDTNPRYSAELVLYAGCISYRLVERPEYKEFKQKETWKRRLDLNGASKDNQNASIENFELNNNRANVLSEIETLVSNYKDGEFQPGLWLVGQNGIGKSYVACALAKELNKKSAGVTFIDFPNYIEELKQSIRNDSNSYDKKLKRLTYVDVLIIDDIGAEKISDWVLESVLYPVLNDRYKFKKITIFTSNLTKRDYIRAICSYPTKLDSTAVNARAKRILTRIDGLAKEVQLIGENKRERY